MYSLGARFARALDEGEPLPALPRRLIEENLWRAIRYGLSGDLIDFERGDVIPARARIEQLIERGCFERPRRLYEDGELPSVGRMQCRADPRRPRLVIS
jgi:gamma-glutamyl:cysteine ligase YbdK (ATP-grasp superfamily)